MHWTRIKKFRQIMLRKWLNELYQIIEMVHNFNKTLDNGDLVKQVFDIRT